MQTLLYTTEKEYSVEIAKKILIYLYEIMKYKGENRDKFMVHKFTNYRIFVCAYTHLQLLGLKSIGRQSVMISENEDKDSLNFIKLYWKLLSDADFAKEFAKEKGATMTLIKILTFNLSLLYQYAHFFHQKEYSAANKIEEKFIPEEVIHNVFILSRMTLQSNSKPAFEIENIMEISDPNSEANQTFFLNHPSTMHFAKQIDLEKMEGIESSR